MWNVLKVDFDVICFKFFDHISLPSELVTYYIKLVRSSPHTNE